MALTDLTSDNNSLRKPGLSISFDGGAAGGLTGSLTSVTGSDDPWQRNLIALKTDSAAAPSVDTVKLLVTTDYQAPIVSLENEGTVALGYEDSSIDLVFTASVESVKRSIVGITQIYGINGGTLLSELRINQAYEQQTAGDIVSDLAGKAGVATYTIENGPEFSYFVVDDRSNAYQHIASLAQKSGYSAFFTPEGKLNFVSLTVGRPVRTFSYAMDIMNLDMNESAPITDSVTVIGAGAAGSQGQEAWPWLVKDPGEITAQAGSGNGGRLVRDASLRSAEALHTAADAAVAAFGLGAVTGRIVVPGAPAVVVGSTIELMELPNAALNGNYLVMRVQHEFSKQRGFISRIDFSKPISGSVSGGLGSEL